MTMTDTERRKVQTEAARAAAVAAAKRRREQKAAELLREAGWKCTPPEQAAA